jgi:ferredoxin
MTGAVKNQYGCVPGMHKGQYHARVPNLYDFARLLVDITAFVKPRIYVMDAVTAMEGNGPMNGTPRRVGAILVSADPVALDATACRLINLDPRYVPFLAAGQDAGLGVWEPGRIDILGDDLERFVVQDFRVVRSAPLSLPDHGITRAIRNAVVTRPEISGAACTRCGACIRACPLEPKALAWHSARAGRPPVYNYNKCIRCFCCHEICPSGAISITTPFLGKLMPFVSYLSLVFSNMIAKSKERAARKMAGSTGLL